MIDMIEKVVKKTLSDWETVPLDSIKHASMRVVASAYREYENGDESFKKAIATFVDNILSATMVHIQKDSNLGKSVKSLIIYVEENSDNDPWLKNVSFIDRMVINQGISAIKMSMGIK